MQGADAPRKKRHGKSGGRNRDWNRQSGAWGWQPERRGLEGLTQEPGPSWQPCSTEWPREQCAPGPQQYAPCGPQDMNTNGMYMQQPGSPTDQMSQYPQATGFTLPNDLPSYKPSYMPHQQYPSQPDCGPWPQSPQSPQGMQAFQQVQPPMQQGPVPPMQQQGPMHQMPMHQGPMHQGMAHPQGPMQGPMHQQGQMHPQGHMQGHMHQGHPQGHMLQQGPMHHQGQMYQQGPMHQGQMLQQGPMHHHGPMHQGPMHQGQMHHGAPMHQHEPMHQGISLTQTMPQGPGHMAHPAPVPLAQVPVPLELEPPEGPQEQEPVAQDAVDSPDSPDPVPQAVSAPLTPHENPAVQLAPLSAPQYLQQARTLPLAAAPPGPELEEKVFETVESAAVSTQVESESSISFEAQSPASFPEALASRDPLVLDKLLAQEPHHLARQLVHYGRDVSTSLSAAELTALLTQRLGHTGLAETVWQYVADELRSMARDDECDPQLCQGSVQLAAALAGHGLVSRPALKDLLFVLLFEDTDRPDHSVAAACVVLGGAAPTLVDHGVGAKMAELCIMRLQELAATCSNETRQAIVDVTARRRPQYPQQQQQQPKQVVEDLQNDAAAANRPFLLPAPK